MIGKMLLDNLTIDYVTPSSLLQIRFVFSWWNYIQNQKQPYAHNSRTTPMDSIIIVNIEQAPRKGGLSFLNFTKKA